MRAAAVAFAEAVAKSGLAAADKRELTAKLADYQRDFFAWVATAQEATQAQEAMSQTYADVEPMMGVLPITARLQCGRATPQPHELSLTHASWLGRAGTLRQFADHAGRLDDHREEPLFQ